MPLQRKNSAAQALEIDLAEDSAIKLKDAYEFMGRQAAGKDTLGHTKQDQMIYLHGKQQQALKHGEAGSLLMQFQKKRTRESFILLCGAIGHHRTYNKYFFAQMLG